MWPQHPRPCHDRAKAAGRAAGRANPYFDNAKYLTIVLVACGHAWEPLTYGSRAATAIYLLVYAFHMPAFALISGYFSRSFDMAPGRVKRLLTVVRRAVFGDHASTAGHRTIRAIRSACSTPGM
ncbi:hypothetical protein SANTM175S_05530 [Streptomyces antimycoticus]